MMFTENSYNCLRFKSVKRNTEENESELLQHAMLHS